MTVEWWMWPLTPAAALVLDLLLGDPEWFPHPVRWIGGAAALLEPPLRALLGSTKFSGAVLVGLIVGGAAAAATAVVVGAYVFDPWVGLAVDTLLVYFAIAPRCLAVEVNSVLAALAADDLPAARRLLARIVGRDTESLDEEGVLRAAVESTAESTGDGVFAPLFFAGLAGGIGAMVYRTINTLDSIVGHADDKYREFGWAGASLDDAANFPPARIGVRLLLSTAARFSGTDAAGARRIAGRDGRRHASPNAGLWEAGFAGALGVQLGGPATYGRVPSFRPTLGDDVYELSPEIAVRGVRLMWAVAVLGTLFAVGLRAAVCYCSTHWAELHALPPWR